MKNQPSDEFIGAILDGFLAEEMTGQDVTPSAIWTQVCMKMPGDFRAMFAWDVGRQENVNRIGTIADCIKAGMVPGLVLSANEKGRMIVKEVRG